MQTRPSLARVHQREPTTAPHRGLGCMMTSDRNLYLPDMVKSPSRLAPCRSAVTLQLEGLMRRELAMGVPAAFAKESLLGLD